MQVKDIIEQEANQPGDIWRALNRQTPAVASAVQKLKSLVPGFEEALDSIVAAHKAKVDQAALAVKKTKIKTPNKILTGVLSGDPFGEKKDYTPVKKLLKAINAMVPRHKFVLTPDDMDVQALLTMVQRLNDDLDLEVDPDDLVPFTFTRDFDDRSELSYIDGAILPNGQIYVVDMSSDRVGDGPYLFDNAQELIGNINQYWL